MLTPTTDKQALLEKVVWTDPERMSGVPCFYGTRVPIKTLFDYLAGGHTIDDFLEGFEGITREQVVAVLELAQEGFLLEAAHSSR